MHALEQNMKLSHEYQIIVVSPVCLRISLRRWRENLTQIKQLPKYYEEIESAPCWRPRYISLSVIPWKYDKQYLRDWLIVISLSWFLLKKRLQPDIIHGHFVYKPGYIATILGKLFHKPVIITAHGSDIHQNLFEEDRLCRERTIYALKNCTKIIAVSDYIKKLIETVGFGEKVKVIPTGYSEKIFQPMDKTYARNSLSLHRDRKLLLFIGNLVRVKGTDILIDAFRIISDTFTDIELFVIGDGAEKENLMNQATRLGIENKIHFLGSRDRNAVCLYINAADIVVVPSRNEGRSVVVLEALACGKPVVASRVGGIPETIIDDNLGILIDKEDPAALASGITNALSREWDSKYLSDYAMQYTSKRMAEELSQVYERLTKL